ncbi:MAG TPA: glycosyltransferase family 4 protein [Blastocatellia bacterium]|nr:glycosyltransferase family 4 protein [Blastocatellia bacterium]
MRVLIVTQIFLPEMGALSSRIYPIARQLVASGHEVIVATGMPNYPAGVVFPRYRGKRSMTEEIDGIRVIRTACYTSPRNQSKLSQMRSYLSFIPAAFRSGLRAKKVDVVITTSPPIFTAIPAMYLAKLYGAKLVFDVRDLWPDELTTYGGIPEDSLAVRMIRAIERRAYAAADCVLGTTRAILDTVVERGVPRENAFYLPNGADLDIFRPLPRKNHVADEYPFKDRFVVMYSGLFGIKHGLEVLLEAAERLKAHKDIVFFLLGNGARREALIKWVEDRGLDNVIIGNERPINDVPYLLARADACFAAVRPEPYPKKVISVKVFEYLACERAVVGALSGESARVLEESQGGIVVPPGDSLATAEAILSLYKDPDRRALMGKLGRRYVEENFSRSTWAARLEERLADMTRSEAAEPKPVQHLVGAD